MEIKEMELKFASVVFPEMKSGTFTKTIPSSAINCINIFLYTEPKVTLDKSTATGDELEPVKVLPKMVNECTMTNEFYSIKDDPYPLFCSKCQVKLNPAPLDQILEQMSSCPALLTEVQSPEKNSIKSK